MLRAFLSPQSEKIDDSIFLDANETHHLVKVRRVQENETVEILDGKGMVLQCKFKELNKNRANLKIIEENKSPKKEANIAIAQAMLKSKAMDFFIQKAIELNVSEIQALFTNNSEVKLDKNKSRKRTEKWQQQAIEAIKQSGNPWLPVIHEPKIFNEYIEKETLQNELYILGSLEEDARPLHQHLKNIRQKDKIHFLIGPEGDFSEKEYEVLRKKEWKAANFGCNVLRAETASIYALSVSNYEFSRDSSV